MNNLIVYFSLNEDDCSIIGKRINRLYDDFWDKQNDLINPNSLLNFEDTIELLDSKFSNLTIIQTIEFILKVIEFYIPDDSVFQQYHEALSDYYSIQNSPSSYEKITIPTITDYIYTRINDYLRGTINFTKMRNFLIITFMAFGIPLKLHNLINIQYMAYEGIEFDDTIDKQICIVKKQSIFYLIFNRGSISNQIIIELFNPILHKLLSIYVVKYKNNNHHFFSTAQGRPISKSNLSNGVVNFTRKEFGFSLTIYDLRKVWYNSYKKTLTEEQKRAYKF